MTAWSEFVAEVDAVVEASYSGRRPTAAKRGRNPKWPWVPIIAYPDPGYLSRQTEQLRARAFETRAEAVQCAEQHLARCREAFRASLLDPRYRANREFHGLPRDLPVEAS